MATAQTRQNNMSVAHGGVTFNHSCLKVPVDPASKRPSPHYERIFNCKLSGEHRDYRKRRETSAVSSTNSSVDNNYKSVESYLQFYEAIPDYSELHHLSDAEFYSRLKSLKITQKRFCSESGVNDDERVLESADRPSSHSSIGFRSKYNPETVYGKRDDSPKKKEEHFRVSSGYSNSSSGRGQVTNAYPKKKNRWTMKKAAESKPAPKINVVSDSENISDLGLEGKGMRVECSCKGSLCDGKSCRGDVSDKDPYGDDCWASDDAFSRKSKSVPNSPGWKPKVWRCAQDACNCCWDALLREDLDSAHVHCIHDGGMKARESPKKQKKFCTRPVPLLSRIPLYEKIMAEQEERRRANHSRYSRELRALVQPFSFTKREEEEKQKLRMTCSNPELTAQQKRSQATFKAKPIPKNLFSNYAYERMREEDLYRALKKRIRAEEMLKSSSLPPSMAAREKKYRSKSLDFLDRSKLRGYKRACEVLKSELEFEEKARGVKNHKRRGKPYWLNRKVSNSVTDSSAEVSPYESVSEPERRHQKRPHSAISINRSNLASVLRMQTVRKRMEKEMADNLEENRVKQQAKFKERLIRMTPAWRALNYSTEEDLALRVAARREEERLKKKRYDKLMGSIYGRVHQMPPLFQRQSSGLKQMKRSCDDETNLKDCKYYEQKKQMEKPDDGGGGETRQAKTFALPSAPSRFRSRFRTHKSSESSGSHDKSEGSKIDESDNETGSREDEIEDYLPQQGDNARARKDADNDSLQ